MLISDSHLLHFLRGVQHGADYHDSVQQVQRNPVWRADVLRPPGDKQMIGDARDLTS